LTTISLSKFDYLWQVCDHFPDRRADNNIYLQVTDMDQSTKMAPQTSLFQVYLRLRPPTESLSPKEPSDQWLIVEPPVQVAANEENSPMPSISTHVTLQPPNDSRKRAVERFNFTKIFKEEATQLDVFEETGAINAVRSLIVEERDGLLATLGVTGSGKVQLSLEER
jgi:hypothetical protein